jgi:hypothetical protein
VLRRQHKVGKQVHCPRCNRIGGSKVEKQVASTRLGETRQSFEHYIANISKPSMSNAETLLNKLELASQLLEDNSQTAECLVDGQKEATYPIVSLLSEFELLEQDELLRMLPKTIHGNAKDIPDSLVYGVGPKTMHGHAKNIPDSQVLGSVQMENHQTHEDVIKI